MLAFRSTDPGIKSVLLLVVDTFSILSHVRGISAGQCSYWYRFQRWTPIKCQTCWCAEKCTQTVLVTHIYFTAKRFTVNKCIHIQMHVCRHRPGVRVCYNCYTTSFPLKLNVCTAKKCATYQSVGTTKCVTYAFNSVVVSFSFTLHIYRGAGKKQHNTNNSNSHIEHLKRIYPIRWCACTVPGWCKVHNTKEKA